MNNLRMLLAAWLLAWAKPLQAGLDFDCREQKTPYSENAVDYCNHRYELYTHDCPMAERVGDLVYWYFYDSCTIGAFQHSDSTFWFVLNEKNCAYNRFADKKLWRQFLKANDLEPRYWKRIYSKHWGFFTAPLSFGFAMMLPVVAILLLGMTVVLFRIIYLAYDRENFRPTKKYTLLTLLIFGSITVRVLLDIFPQSF